MIEKLLHTDPDYAWTFVRIIAGLIVFPYGMQKLFGWFGGPGIGGTLKDLDSRRIPRSIAWLIIVGQSFGSIALVAGFLGWRWRSRSASKHRSLSPYFPRRQVLSFCQG